MAEEATTVPGLDAAHEVLRRAARDVPAYRDFLLASGVDARAVSESPDLTLVPEVTKRDYLKAYNWPDLLSSGDVNAGRVISMSTGSSGVPFAWPRDDGARAFAADRYEDIYRNCFGIADESVLLVVAFAMGTWIGGTYTLQASEALGQRGMRITAVTPGINTDEILHILKSLSPHFGVTILAGYPPFIKDVLDKAAPAGALEGISLRLQLAGETISESWRDYALQKIDQQDPAFVVAMYGTADAGVIGHETRRTIALRRRLDRDQDARERLFPGVGHTPTLVSYEPNQRFAEVVDGHLVFTIGGALPLVRYRILDLGRLLSSSDRELEALFPQSSEGDVEPHMLALYGRTDIAASYYAINVYPDHIKAGLEPFVQLGELTGKFVARVEHDESHTQSLIIQAELGPGPTDSDVATEAVAISVTDSLVALGAEFRELISHLGPTAAPRIELAPNGAEQFRIHIKQRWVL